MADLIILPPFPTPPKPRKGEPCNGCGWCCHHEVCSIGQLAFPGSAAPCPGIVYQDGAVRCAIVLMEIKAIEIEPSIEPLIQRSLGTGCGCDADDPEEQ
jgi:hypothetical protein